ncbi:DNA repair protein RadA [uncultured Finegoldia sp.]|uniref:DNA repair protein RadA n=1 Tax=uncultured Finegoldia sp. TaxID=328009 RepID=UPI00263890BC|nr:DNA repair protein RadA [uncultured Finegoldia sp.]
MKKKTKYVCKNCGYEQAMWIGKCPSCNSWGSMQEREIVDEKSNTTTSVKSTNAIKLVDVKIDSSDRIQSSITELNRVFGGGLVRDSVSILTARPGAGKSTLLLELANDLAKKNIKVLYISGEESTSQIKQRAMRTMEEIPENIWLISTTSMDNALDSINKIKPDVIFLDSIQTFQLREYNSRPGSPVQTVECANKIVEICKDPEKPTLCIMVGHMTKSDEMAGLRTLEHLVDTVLYLEGESDEPLRLLTTTKNRFGRTGEIGLFNMQEDGIKEITDASDYFVTKRKKDVNGAALSVIKEGSRILVVEVEALVSKSFTPYPQRIGDSLRKDQLNTLISILEERAGINMYDKNVIIKTTGGIKIQEQSVNLSIIMAIASSLMNKAISSDVVFIGEVGLTGEIKRVPQIETRLREIERLGYKKVYISQNTKLTQKYNLEIKQFDSIRTVISDIF